MIDRLPPYNLINCRPSPFIAIVLYMGHFLEFEHITITVAMEHHLTKSMTLNTMLIQVNTIAIIINTL